MTNQEAEAVLKLSGIPYGRTDECDGDVYVYDKDDDGEDRVVAYITQWEWQDGVVTYTIYDDKDGRYIKDIAVVPYDFYSLTPHVNKLPAGRESI